MGAFPEDFLDGGQPTTVIMTAEYGGQKTDQAGGPQVGSATKLCCLVHDRTKILPRNGREIVRWFYRSHGEENGFRRRRLAKSIPGMTIW
jgi:hypothetical protein